MRDCWSSVSPTHLEETSPISIIGKPHSLANAIDRKDFPADATGQPHARRASRAWHFERTPGPEVSLRCGWLATVSNPIPAGIFEADQSLAIIFIKRFLLAEPDRS